jgi:hypothetical protein
MLLTFDLNAPDGPTRRISVNPAAVAAVVESEYKFLGGGYANVAKITLLDGTKYVVRDENRRVAIAINDAMAKAVE